MIQRTEYLKKLEQLKDKHIIKVITGVRRCGKSTLLKQFRDSLLKQGVSKKQTYFANFEEKENLELLDWRSLHDDIVSKLVPKKMNYIFLDEVQNVNNWEKMVDSLSVKDNVDLYLTGSNAYFLSSEFATLLAGRQFELKLYPFSFPEYQSMLSELNLAPISETEQFSNFLRFGSLPQSVEMFAESEELGYDYLRGIFNTIVVKDMITRGDFSDVEVLERVLRYAFDNVGNAFSAKKVADYLSANYRTVSSRTVEKILNVATDSLILYRTERFDIRGKELLKTQQKYYLVDSGFRNVVLGRDVEFDLGRVLENTVYLELRRRGYQVWVGKTGLGKEVDFVAKTPKGETTYIQVTETMRGEDTRKRELAALQSIADSHPKLILSLDPEENNYEGVRQLNLINWLKPNQ